MTITRKLDYVILDLIESSQRTIRTLPLNLGAVPGAGGGIGAPPGGYIGFLPQTRVAYDTDEIASSGITGSGTLLDNLNHIRYRLGTLESGASIVVVDDNTPSTYLDVDTIHFSGAGITVTNLGGGDVRVTVAAGSGGAALTVQEQDGSPIVTNVDKIIFSGATVSDLGGGDVLIAIAASGGTGTPLTVQEQDGSPIVTNVDKIIFSGATISDLGSGDVLVSIITSGGSGTPLTVVEIDGSPSVANVDKIIFSGATVTDSGSGDALVSIYPESVGSPFSRTLFLDSTDSAISTYDTLTEVVPAVGVSAPTTTITGDTLVKAFATSAGLFSFLEKQVLYAYVSLYKAGGTKDLQGFVQVYHRTTGGTETLLGTSNYSPVLTTGVLTEVNFSIKIERTIFISTDRLVFKVYGHQSGAGTDPSMTFNYGDVSNNSLARLSFGSTMKPYLDTLYAPITGITHTNMTNRTRAIPFPALTDTVNVIGSADVHGTLSQDLHFHLANGVGTTIKNLAGIPVPQDVVAGGTCNFVFLWSSDAAGNNCNFTIVVREVGNNDASHTSLAANTADYAAHATANNVKSSSLAMTAPTPGKSISFALIRNGAAGGDTNTGTVSLWGVFCEYTADM